MSRSTPTLATLLVLAMLFAASPARATTLSEVLAGIDSIKRPPELATLSFMGDMRIDLTHDATGLLPEQASLLAAWRAPDEWFVTWELSGELASGMRDMGGGHPAVDHVFLARPDALDLLYRDWTVEYQGTALWEGEPAWQLLFRLKDFTADIPSFNLIVRKDDFVPVRASVSFSDGTTAITDLNWIILEDVLVPAKFTTRFDQPLGPLNGYETTFFNHAINPDLTDVDFPRGEGTLLSGNEPDVAEGPAVFEELYHGFADEPIVAPLNDESGTYDSVEFTFSLYVEDAAIVSELDSHKDEIRELAIEIISEWEWTGENGLSDPTGKWKCGDAIREAINELLQTAAVTDFYFLEWEAVEGE